RAVLYLLLAGEQAERVFANEEAERHYRAALDLARERKDPRLEAAALEMLGGVLVLRGRYEEALERSEDSAGIYRSEDDPAGMARTAMLLAWAHQSRGTLREGLARILPLLGELENQPPSLPIANLFWTV